MTNTAMALTNIAMALFLFLLDRIYGKDYRKWSSPCRVAAVANLLWGIWLLVSRMI